MTTSYPAERTAANCSAVGWPAVPTRSVRGRKLRMSPRESGGIWAALALQWGRRAGPHLDVIDDRLGPRGRLSVLRHQGEMTRQRFSHVGDRLAHRLAGRHAAGHVGQVGAVVVFRLLDDD